MIFFLKNIASCYQVPSAAEKLLNDEVLHRFHSIFKLHVQKILPIIAIQQNEL